MNRSKRIFSLLLAIIFTLISSTTMLAHSGRTDGSGGHRDNKNKSGLGSYHYHCGGYSAHLHKNGICPYTSTSKTTSSSLKSTSSFTLTKDKIKTAQSKLNKLGYNCGKADGVIGTNTKRQ